MSRWSNLVEIHIVDTRVRSWPRYLKRMIGVGTVVIAPVWIGIAYNSVLMQIMGFVFTVAFGVIFAKEHSKETTFTSIPEAKAYLDELERRWPTVQ